MGCEVASSLEVRTAMSNGPEPLSDDAIGARLAEVPGWARDGGEIVKAFRHTFNDCVLLAVYVAGKANELNHHPDIHLSWGRAEFRISTHSAGGRLTELDFALAKAIDAIAKSNGAAPEQP
jgi:4a-hydroxytetrahydrobiopterin dehydratase